MSSSSRSRPGTPPRPVARTTPAALVVGLAGCGGPEPLGIVQLDRPAPAQQARGVDGA